MTPRPPAARVGLFALIGVGLLVAAVTLIWGGRLFASTEPAVLHFRGSVYGLQVGAPVVFRGVRIGSVKSIGVVHDEGRFAVPVLVALDRQRIQDLKGGPVVDDPGLSLPALVQRGLSGQLATQSLLTGQLYIDLDLRGGGQPAQRSLAGVVEIPTTLTRFQSLQDQLDRVDLTRISEDLTAALGAARGLLAGPELKQTLAELAQASAALARLSATLDRKAGPLADAAQGTLARAGDAMTRVGTAADRVTGAADAVDAAAGAVQTTLTAGSPLLNSVQQAADELGRSAAALRAATAEDSATVQGLQRALADVARAARAVRELSDVIEQQPQVLLHGRPAAP
jgi:paraquat-inducible protein B